MVLRAIWRTFQPEPKKLKKILSQKEFLIFPEIGLPSSNIKKILIFFQLFMYFLKRKFFLSFLIFQETKTSKKIFIFQETEALKSFLYFRKYNFLSPSPKNKTIHPEMGLSDSKLKSF